MRPGQVSGIHRANYAKKINLEDKKEGISMEAICEICGKDIKLGTLRHKYCAQNCAYLW